jgi:signal transduction histidine kinase/CheY-like chemotaxis protein
MESGNQKQRRASSGRGAFTVRDESKTREQLISELIRMREEIARLKDIDIAARRLDCAEQLAMGLSHNFNNILTPILGYSQLGAKAKAADARLNTYFNEIAAAAEKAAELTTMLLAFSGRQIRYPRLINLNAFILNQESTIKEIVGDRANVLIRLSSDPGLVKVDPKQIEQVIKSLAENCRDAMPDGGVMTVETASVYLEDDNSGRWPRAFAGDHVMIVVSDMGIGMTEEVRKHAFEPFYSTREPWDRTGLGLSACYGIVSQNGGRIDIQSKPGDGTVVRIYLPQATTTPRPPCDDDSEPENTPTILVIESDPAIADLAYRALREHGYQVITALSATNTTDDYGEELIDLVVTSIVKPSGDIKEVEAHIGDMYPGCPVVQIVPYVDFGDTETPRRFNAVRLLCEVKKALPEQ